MDCGALQVGKVGQKQARSITGDDGLDSRLKSLGENNLLIGRNVRNMNKEYRYKHVQEVAKEPKII